MSEGANSYIEAFYDSYGRGVQKGVGVMIPAAVVEYDRDTHRIKVRPLVALDQGDKYVSQGDIICTAWRPFSGKFLVDMPIEVGDTGWVLASDDDTQNVKEHCVHDADGKIPDVWIPQTGWMHSYSSGIFFPDRWGGKYQTDENHVTKFDNDDKNRLVIQSEDGKQKISIGTVGGTLDIKVTAGSTIAVEAPIAIVKSEAAKVEAGSVDVKANSGVTMDAPDAIFKHGISPANGVSGTFYAGGHLVTVTKGIVTGI